MKKFTEPKPLRAVLIERVSLRISCGYHASMTVEASLVLPLFIFFMAEILSIFDMIRLQSRFIQALHETGTQMSEYAFYVRNVPSDLMELAEQIRGGGGAGQGTDTGDAEGQSEEKTDEIISETAGFGISLVLSEYGVRRSVEEYMGTDYLDNSCLEGGAASVSYLRSGILRENDVIDLVADYRVKPLLPLFGLEGFSMQSRYYGHAWTGYEVSDDNPDNEEENNEEIVFITRTGSVYHRNRSCTYLKPQIYQVSAASLDRLRSSDGAKYYACENCRPSRTGTVVVAKYGNRYHRSSSCTSIHRDITEVKLSQVQDTMRPCSKCGGTSGNVSE